MRRGNKPGRRSWFAVEEAFAEWKHSAENFGETDSKKFHENLKATHYKTKTNIV